MKSMKGHETWVAMVALVASARLRRVGKWKGEGRKVERGRTASWGQLRPSMCGFVNRK